jgi:hypothetical protein
MIGTRHWLAVWLASVAGMAIGLSVDCRNVSPAALANICASGESLGILIRHLAALPATNIGMAAGTLVAFALTPPLPRLTACRGLACYALMLLGMTFGGSVGVALAGEASIAWGAPVMLAAMIAGMTAGMMVAEPLSRFRERGQAEVQMQMLASGGKPLKFTAE